MCRGINYNFNNTAENIKINHNIFAMTKIIPRKKFVFLDE